MAETDSKDGKKAAQTIIIKKIDGGGGGHHGGAWKVAYADFVTAMMAFFLLLWLLSSVPQKKLEALASYFTPTIGIIGGKGIGVKGGSTTDPDGTESHTQSERNKIVFGATTTGPIVMDPTKQKNELNEESNFLSLKHSLDQLVSNDPDLAKFADQIVVDMTPEGLQIELLDSRDHPMFERNTDVLMPYAKMILQKVIPIIRYMPNYIMLAGHTAPLQNSNDNFDLWKLSADRSNATRKFVVGNGIDPAQIGVVTGLADREPFDKTDLNAPANMRIGIIMLKQAIMAYSRPVVFSQ